MKIRIEGIDVKNLGPLNTFSEKLNDINLFYGKNEVGKSFLVEFIIKVLFKNVRAFEYIREIPGKGKITLSFDKEKQNFSLKSRDKLEKVLSEKLKLPVSTHLSRLLIVKSGDIKLDKSRAGAEKNLLRKLISEEKSQTENMVPFLGKIPLIGYFFKNKTSRRIRTELFLLITPRIVTDSVDIDALSDAFRRKLPWLKEDVKRVKIW